MALTLMKFSLNPENLNFATGVIFGRRKFDHVSDLRDKLDWLASLFVLNQNFRDRHTRQDNLLHLQSPRLETVKRRFEHQASALLSSLPSQVVRLPPSSVVRSPRAALMNRSPFRR